MDDRRLVSSRLQDVHVFWIAKPAQRTRSNEEAVLSVNCRRRLLLAMGALLLAPIGVQAQSRTKPYRIGVLAGAADNNLQRSLHELGYVEGRDIVFEVRDAEGRLERLDDMARDLVHLDCDIIVAPNPAAVLSVKRATATIPIVMMNTPDPVQLGFVASLARPGGNITGVTTLTIDLSIKQLELLKQAIPGASRIALLWNPDNPWHPVAVKYLEDSGKSLGFLLTGLKVRSPNAFDSAFQAMVAERAQAVLVLADPMTYAHRVRLADLAIAHRLPMMSGLREYAVAGSLMSYWADRADLYRRVASYVNRILKGAKPGDLPIEQPTKFEFIVNLKTAKALGITIPQSVLLRADQLIE